MKLLKNTETTAIPEPQLKLLPYYLIWKN